MRYTVIGLDRQSGELRTTALEAANQGEADLKAAALGWFIESVKPEQERVEQQVPLVPKGGSPESPITAKTILPDYREIQDVAQWVKLMGSVLFVLGAVAAILGCLAAMPANGLAAFNILYTSAISAAALIAGGCILKMLAELGLAHRDLVRNSFRNLAGTRDTGQPTDPPSMHPVDG